MRNQAQERHYPSPFVAGDVFTLSNRHGSCELVAASDPRPVRGMRLEDAPAECIVSMVEVEQVALITDQVRLQPVIGSTTRCALIRHDTTSTAAFVRVRALNYTTEQPAQDQIEADMRAGRNRIYV